MLASVVALMNIRPPTGWETLVIVLPSILAFLTASLSAILAFQAKAMSAQNAGKIDQLHVVVNSRLTELLAATERSARAEGMAAGKQDQVAEQARAADPTGSIAAETARVERTADAVTARAIRVADAAAVAPSNTETHA